MPANTDPIFSRAGDIQSAGYFINAAAATLYDGAGTVSSSSSGTGPHKVFQADSTNGGFARDIRFKYGGTTTTASNATVMKILIGTTSSGSVTDSNTWVIGEIALPAVTPSATSANPDFVYPLNMALPLNYCVFVKNLTAQPANMGWYATAIGGKY